MTGTDGRELYPEGPRELPTEFKRATPAYVRKAWLATFGLLGFVGLYGFSCFWFGRLAYRSLEHAFRGGHSLLLGLFVGGTALLLAVFLAKALLFIARPDTPVDVELTRDEQPELFRFIDSLVRDTKAPRPHRVLVVPGVNAAVFQERLSLANLFVSSQKSLVIGLGLVNALTISELKAVLAHEFGHFAQRSLAVGRWVYVAQQIAGQVVARRDRFDRALHGLSSTDLRIAWLGWVLRLVVWSVRALVDTAFRLLLVAQRALSREMEFQADLVAVSVSGSDALIHALHRLQAADAAFDRTLEVVSSEHARGVLVPDLFALQSRILERTRAILGDETFGVPPALPDTDRARHRVFEQELAEAPRMWATHPSNRDREENAKRVYVAAELDDRPAWSLFAAADELRVSVTRAVLPPLTAESRREATPEEALSAVDARFSRVALAPCYRGAYLFRSPVLHVESAEELADGPSGASVLEELERLYPPELPERLKRWRHLEREVATLEALARGSLDAPGGVIRHRGTILKRRELPRVISKVKHERDLARELLAEHDRACRSAHRHVARSLGQGWPKYLKRLAALLHYASHAEAELDDAWGHLSNVFAIVTADGRVSRAEHQRLTGAAYDMYTALKGVYAQARGVLLPPAVAMRFGSVSLRAEMPPRLLPAPTPENVGDFLRGAEGWYRGFSGLLGKLGTCTLDALLEAEAHVAKAFVESADPGPAPPAARVPKNYVTRAIGTERERQHRLDLWNRFVLADGVWAGIARFVVAAAVLAPLVGFSVFKRPTIVVYNALDADLVVEVGDERFSVPRSSSFHWSHVAGSLPFRTQTSAGVPVEAFVADASNELATYVYNVAGASPLAEATAVYGNRSPRGPRMLGNPRFFETHADFLFRDPPTQLSSKSRGGERSVLVGLAGAAPDEVVASIRDASEQRRIIALHARCDLPTSPRIVEWLDLASLLPNFAELVEERRAREPADPAALVQRQVGGGTQERNLVCGRHPALLGARLGDPITEKFAAYCR